MWRGWRWGGVDIGDRQARFWGVPLSSRGRFRARLIDFVAHRRRFSAFRLAEGDMATYTTELNRYRPDFVYGYVSILVEYANYLESAGTRRFTPKAIFATSEVLTPQHRSAIERGFGGRVFEEYGCGELGNLAHECEKGSLHISAENMVVEIVPAAAGNSAGEIIVTELNNLAMPLLRYRLNDFASPIDGACACGRKLPRIGDVVGRAYDVIYNRDGRMFHGEFFMYIFEEVKQKGLGVQRFQVIQHDFDHFTIRVQPGPGYGPETEAFVRRRVSESYGDYAHIVFEPVQSIERERSGKLRLIIGCGKQPHTPPDASR